MAASPPTPPTNSSATVRPTVRWNRMLAAASGSFIDARPDRPDLDRAASCARGPRRAVRRPVPGHRPRPAMVHAGKRARPVGDHDDDAAARRDAADRLASAPARRRRRDWNWARRARPGTDRRRARAPAPTRCRCPAESAAPPSPTRVSKPSGRRRIISCDAGRLRRRDDGSGIGVRRRSGRCSRRPCRRTVRRPAADSRCGGRAPRRPIARAPRRRAGPCRAAPARRRRARAPAWTCRRRSGRSRPARRPRRARR